MYIQKQGGCSLGDVAISLKTGPVKLEDLAQTSDLHFPPILLNLGAKVQQFGGVIAQNRKLVNVGNSVRIDNEVVSGQNFNFG